MLNLFKLSARFFWREWKRGQWIIVFLSVMIAVSVVTALDFYSDRLKRGIEENNAKWLGGDAVINSSTPIPTAWVKEAHNENLTTAEVWSYPSVLVAKNKMQLVNLLAVSDNYPLLGEHQRPEKQTVWIEPRLSSLLSLNLGQSLMIGAAEFKVAQFIKNENALMDTGWFIAPRAIILLHDVPATKTVIPGSRINYHLLIVGDAASIQTFKIWLSPQLQKGQRLIDVHNEENRLASVIDQIENFLQLVLLICLTLCCIAIVLSVQCYLHNQYRVTALMRSLGTKQNQIMWHYLNKLIFVALFAGLLGIVTGYAAQTVLAQLFQTYMTMPLPMPEFKPILFGFLLSGGLVLVFAYPIVSVLPKTSPLFLWRNEVYLITRRNTFYYLITFVMLLLFIYSFTGFSLLTLLFLNFIAVSVCVLYALSLLLLALLKKYLSKTSGVLHRGLSQLVHYPDNTSLQFISFTLILMLIIVLSIMRGSLIRHWQDSFAQTTPNYFAINLAPTDLSVFEELAQYHQVMLSGIYPLVRGRLSKLNGRPIMQAIPASARDNNALHRELNLTWMETFPSDNRIIKGESWSGMPHGTPVISVEKNLADDLQLKLGDQLSFQIGEQDISAKILNIRTVSWTSFHPNFFVIFMPGVMNHFPATYITSFHLPDTKKEFLNQVVGRFPNVTLIDVADLLKQIQDIISKITYASQYLLFFSLGAALLVLVASVQTSVEERKSAYKLWRIFGASRQYIRQSIIMEFGSIFLIVVFFAYLFAKLFVYLIDMRIFNWD